MSKVLDDIKKRASVLGKNIVLPEGEDKRVVEAAAVSVKEGVAKITLLGNPDEIKAANPDVDLSGVTVIDPLTYHKTEEYANLLYELRKAKGMTLELARETLKKDYTMYGALMLKAPLTVTLSQAQGLYGRRDKDRKESNSNKVKELSYNAH